MSKFRNRTDVALRVPSLGVVVEPGAETPDLTPEQAAGFVEQTDTWEAVTPAKTAPKENN